MQCAQVTSPAPGAHAAPSRDSFVRALSVWDLTFLGVGVAVGSGIFVLTAHAAAHHAGPAVTLSFLLAALAAGMGALCYAEMASTMPVAGSAYAYASATLGQAAGFLIGWDLVLEYMVGAATVAAGWSAYLVGLVAQLTGVTMPRAWTQAPWAYDASHRTLSRTGAFINVPAVLVIGGITWVLVRGVRGSARLNACMVALKTFAVLAFVVVCARAMQWHNWQPYVPQNAGVLGVFGFSGVMQGAALLFFAFLGIDNLTTAALEAHDPQRTLPRAILYTLGVCTLLYVSFAMVLTGVLPVHELGLPQPLARAAARAGAPWLEILMTLGGTAGLTSVLLVQLYGQPRIFFAMAQDGLLPSVCATVHPRYHTPHVATCITGAVCALGAGLLPVELLAQLCSAGTLFAFLLVSLGVLALRQRRPDLPRRFRLPLGPAIPLASCGVCCVLLCAVGIESLGRLAVWLAVGALVYVLYSRPRRRRRHTTAAARSWQPRCEA